MQTNKLIIIPSASGFKVIKTGSIVRIEALRAYCSLKLADGTCLMISKSLKEVEEMINLSIFFRCHKSHLVNVLFIDQYFNKDGSELLLLNGDTIPLSKNRKEELLNLMQSITISS